jgi:hypothetical protein
VAGDGCLKIAPRLALQPFANAPGEVSGVARHRQYVPADLPRLEDNQPAPAAMLDPARFSAQWENTPVQEGKGACRAAKAAVQPSDMPAQKILAARKARPRRQREDRQAG